MKQDLQEGNLLRVLNKINFHNNLATLGIMISIRQNRDMSDKIKRLLLELLLWKPYKYLIWKLLEKGEPIFSVEELRNFAGKI